MIDTKTQDLHKRLTISKERIAGGKKKRSLLQDAIQLAEQSWKNGDEKCHDEMADYITTKGDKQFRELHYSRLKKELIPIAREYRKVWGDKGVKRSKEKT